MTVNKYQIYCETESSWKYVWGTDPPTTCPTNTAHTVNLSSVAVINSISNDDVIVRQPTAGLFEIEEYKIDITAGIPGSIKTHDIVFDSDILLWTTQSSFTNDLIGDKFDIVVNPDTVVGFVTIQGNVSDTILNVSSTVTGNVKVGMYLRVLDNNASPINSQDLGKVLAVDSNAGTVTISNSLTDIYPVGSLLILTVYLAKNINVLFEGNQSYNDKGFNGRLIKSGTILRLVYTNNNGNAKTVYWRLGYYYGADFTNFSN